jgi:DNA-binding protein HU-alpha
MKQPSSKKTAPTAARATKTPKPVKSVQTDRPLKAVKAVKAVEAAEVESTPVLRKKDLVLRVAEISGVKKKDARAVVEAALAEIGAALSRGDALVLPPLGRAKVNRHKEKGSAEVLVLRLRRGGGNGPRTGAEGALAEADD